MQLTPARRRERGPGQVDWVAMSPASSARASRPYSRLAGATVPEEAAVLASAVTSPRYKGAVPTVEVQLFEKVSAEARPKARRRRGGAEEALTAADLGVAVAALRRFALQFDGFEYPAASMAMYLRDQASSSGGGGAAWREAREYPEVDAKVATVMQAVLREHAKEYAKEHAKEHALPKAPASAAASRVTPADNDRAHFSDRVLEELAASSPLGSPGEELPPEMAEQVAGFLEGAGRRIESEFAPSVQ